MTDLAYFMRRRQFEHVAKLLAEKRRRVRKKLHAERGRYVDGVWTGGLLEFVKDFWHILEPDQKFVSGWPLEAIALHLEAVSFGEVNRLLMNVPPGPMRWDSVVETSTGPKLLRDIAVGDSVLTHKGRYRPVTAVHHQGMLPILRIVTNSGRVTHAAPSHPYLTPKGWTDAKDLCIGNRLAVVNPVGRDADRVRPELARLLGYLVGDGSVTHAPSFVNSDIEIIEDFERCCSVLGMATSRTRVKNHWLIRVNGGESVRAMLRRHGLLGASSYTKRISSVIMNAGRSTIAEFMGAYWSCDGMIDVRDTRARGSRYRASCTTVSEGLAGDILACLTQMGVEGRVRRKVRDLETAAQPGGKYVSFNVEVQREDMTAKFADVPSLCSRKRSLAALCQRSFDRPIWDDEIVSIDVDEPAECMCLTVDEDHSFTCSGIAVKNTMKSLLTDVFWPAWEWSAMKKPGKRFVAFSYSSSLTERDNERFASLLNHPDFKAYYSTVFDLKKTGEKKVTNNKRGWKLASSIGGVGTGERGDIIILDDPHNVKESESETVRKETVRWFGESMSDRMNNLDKGAIVVIMQRVHEEDVSGEILTKGLDYVHLSIPMEYVWAADEDGDPYTNDLGWSDPRWDADPEECDGDLMWPDRFSPQAVKRLQKEKGPYAYAGQYQQTPEARGGGIIKREFWQHHEGKFPSFSYIIASLDSSFGEKEMSDPSALTVWGIYQNEYGHNRAMLIFGFRKVLQFEGMRFRPDPGENQRDFMERQMREWGLIEWTYETCKRWKVDRLLIENKASGQSAAQSLRKRYANARFSVELVEPKGDKVARAIAVQSSFSNRMIYAPTERDWCTDVIDEAAVFPNGRYDDYTDSVTQAVKHLRDMNLLELDEDVRIEEIQNARLEAVKAKTDPVVTRYGGIS